MIIHLSVAFLTSPAAERGASAVLLLFLLLFGGFFLLVSD